MCNTCSIQIKPNLYLGCIADPKNIKCKSVCSGRGWGDSLPLSFIILALSQIRWPYTPHLQWLAQKNWCKQITHTDYIIDMSLSKSKTYYCAFSPQYLLKDICQVAWVNTWECIQISHRCVFIMSYTFWFWFEIVNILFWFEIVNIRTVSIATLGKLQQDSVMCMCAFPNAQLPSSTEL